MKKKLKITLFILFIGFSFFYTEKIVKLARNVDPIMNEIKNNKDDFYIKKIKPVIKDDEYIAGLNGCSVDVEKSYEKMKQINKYNEDLIVMKEIINKVNRNDKYIVGGNKLKRNISVLIQVDKKLDENILKYISNKKIEVNFFVDGKFLENNFDYIKILSKYGNIYYNGRDNTYVSKELLYDNNLIESLTNNKSNYCLVTSKNNKVLKLCNNYGMEVIKTKKYNNVSTVKDKIQNGSIFLLDMDVTDFKLTINYILSKGYSIIKLDKLVDESNNCQ